MGRIALAVAVLCALLAPAAQAAPLVGVGEQSPQMFASPYYRLLGLQDARVVVAWNALSIGWQRREVDAWMRAAEATNTRVLVTITRGRGRAERHVLPTLARYRRAFIAFRKRYPFVKSYIPWNEANHCSQPTCRHPEVAAHYYDIIRSVCHSCTVVAGDVLDQPGMERWLRRFQRAVRHRPTVWGLHNYLDANRFRSDGTRTMLRLVRGEVWFTETGGLVRRGNHSTLRFPNSTDHAAEAVRWVLRLARLSSRIRRIYFYQWTPATDPSASWDSALFDRHGRPRPAYRVLRHWVQEDQASRAPQSVPPT